ncbi:pilin [Xanthomonas arboricola]|uniref:pilin n=1 Tax=Xanthomonas arboricola TaxID=56448 RepID=UPI000E1F0B27|nr:pilin [Xanthomonas arboricola]
MRKVFGFTLIEATIVVAIIAVLASIALPVYQKYLAKTQIAAALAEIRAGETTIESAQQEDRGATLITADYVGLKISKRCASVEAQLDSTGSATISCVLAGNSQVNGLQLYLRRSTEGRWICDASAFEASLRPIGCL